MKHKYKNNSFMQEHKVFIAFVFLISVISVSCTIFVQSWQGFAYAEDSLGSNSSAESLNQHNSEVLPKVENRDQVLSDMYNKGITLSDDSNNQPGGTEDPGGSLLSKLYFQVNTVEVMYDGNYHDVAGQATDRGVAVSWIATRELLPDSCYTVQYSVTGESGPWSFTMPTWKDVVHEAPIWYKIDVTVDGESCTKIKKGSMTITSRKVYYVTEPVSKKYDGTTNVDFMQSRYPNSETEPDLYSNNDGFASGEGWSSYYVTGQYESKNADNNVKVVNAEPHYVLNSGTLESNYEFHHVVKDGAILPREINYVFTPQNREYDGTRTVYIDPFKYLETGDGFVSGEGINIDSVTGEYDGKDSGKHSVSSFDFKKSFKPNTLEQNYSITATCVDGNITPKPVTVNVASTKEYDGSSLKYIADGKMPEIKGMVGDEEISASFETIGEDSGIYLFPEVAGQGSVDYHLTFVQSTGALQINYIVTANADLRITPVNMVIDIVGKSEVIQYDAVQHSVEGYDVDCTSRFYSSSYLNLISGKEAKASGIDVGDYPMGLTKDDFVYSDTNPNIQSVTINYEDGVLSITKAPLAIKVDDTKKYDGEKFSRDAKGNEIQGLQGLDRLNCANFITCDSKVNVYTTDAQNEIDTTIAFDESSRQISNDYNVSYYGVLRIEDEDTPYVPPVTPDPDNPINKTIDQVVNKAIASSKTGDIIPLATLIGVCVAALTVIVSLLVFSKKHFRRKSAKNTSTNSANTNMHVSDGAYYNEDNDSFISYLNGH